MKTTIIAITPRLELKVDRAQHWKIVFFGHLGRDRSTHNIEFRLGFLVWS
ncbi:MAG: hypothetical protein JKY56_02090 [Kofleriaceae bacterium]|nr:hypothetical protein [Kofleriaceae bacterium]